MEKGRWGSLKYNKRPLLRKKRSLEEIMPGNSLKSKKLERGKQPQAESKG